MDDNNFPYQCTCTEEAPFGCPSCLRDIAEQSKVVQLFKPVIKDTTSGPMICANCKHEWDGIIEVELMSIECPSCGCIKGIRKGFTIPRINGEDQWRWECNCRGQLFFILPDHYMCACCGHLKEKDSMR